MARDSSIPGFPEISDWPALPKPPLRIASHGVYRDGGPRGGTYYVDLQDAKGALHPFFFDRFLGRLCFGSSYETGDDAAFLKRGSKIETEAFAIIDALASKRAEFSDVLEHLNHAKNWI